MKYFAGMFFPSRFCTELGKNFPFGPSPSPSIVSVESAGFFTRYAFFHATFRPHHAPALTAAIASNTIANRNAAAPAPSPSHLRFPSHEIARKNTPTTHRATSSTGVAFLSLPARFPESLQPPASSIQIGSQTSARASSSQNTAPAKTSAPIPRPNGKAAPPNTSASPQGIRTNKWK